MTVNVDGNGISFPLLEKAGQAPEFRNAGEKW